MLEDARPDAITLAMPNRFHHDATLAAALAGVHVICEKPLAMNLVEADRMIEACRVAGVHLLYAEQLCFAPRYRKVRDLIRSGALGTIIQVQHHERHGGPHASWFHDPVLSGGGVLLDMGCHGIELTRWLLDRPAVAIVGARNASAAGGRFARALASDLAGQDLGGVSGLARGIDTAAHLAALQGGTVAVLGGGVDVIYPAENDALARAIDEKGCRISEHPPGLDPQARHFPLRNRIVAGLSRAVIVVEAAAKSGSLITARAALDYGREVMAVPGHPFDARASGCNMLIRDGAVLVRGVSDVFEALGAPGLALSEPQLTLAPIPGPEAPQRPLKDVALLHSMILSRLGPSPLAEDQLMRDLKVTPAQLAPELLNLELEGRIARQPGGLLSRLD